MSRKTSIFNKYSISIVIPGYNEEASIKKVIKQTNSLLEKITSNYEIITIDDGSIDNTYRILKELKKKIPKLKIKRHVKNQGFGKTIKELYYSAKKQLIFSLPGNGQIDIREILKLLPFAEKYDMIIGVRKYRYVVFTRKLQSKIYNFLIRTLLGLPLTDINSVRLLKRSKLRSVKINSNSAFVDAELCYKFKKQGFKILEVPINHIPGPSRGGGSLRTIIPTILEIFRFWPQRGD